MGMGGALSVVVIVAINPMRLIMAVGMIMGLVMIMVVMVVMGMIMAVFMPLDPGFTLTTSAYGTH
jgi:hypothetical protein